MEQICTELSGVVDHHKKENAIITWGKFSEGKSRNAERREQHQLHTCAKWPANEWTNEWKNDGSSVSRASQCPLIRNHFMLNQSPDSQNISRCLPASTAFRRPWKLHPSSIRGRTETLSSWLPVQTAPTVLPTEHSLTFSPVPGGGWDEWCVSEKTGAEVIWFKGANWFKTKPRSAGPRHRSHHSQSTLLERPQHAITFFWPWQLLQFLYSFECVQTS